MGKSVERNVWDYLMSIDYGVCMGPVDSFNQVWVKDRPIWCGLIPEAKAVTVYQPDLFGGDNEGEGGVEGCIEMFLGTDDQMASTALASRFGATPATWPGYRGVAHLFFRGAAGATPGQLVGSGESGIDSNAVSRDNGQGFKWASNNPYMPAVKVHATRMPRQIAANFASVPQPGGITVDGSGNVTWTDASVLIGDGDPEITALPSSKLTASPPSGTPATSGPGGYPPGGGVGNADLWSYVTPEQINSGAVVFRGGFSGTGNTFGGGGGPYIMFTRVMFFADNGSGAPDLANPLVVEGEDFFASGFYQRQFNGSFTNSVEIELTVPANTRFVYYDNFIQFFVEFGSSFTVSTLTAQIESLPVSYSYCSPDGDMTGFPDANPANVIYECLTNTEWGKGEAPTAIDVASFEAAAQTLYSERFGISLIWTRQDTIRAIVQEILDHIKGFLYLSPLTGLWTLKLLRDDYDPATRPLLDETNCRATKRKRRAWGETINEIVVSYTDPNTEAPATVAAQDDGNINLQGAIISETREYPGIRSARLAQWIAERDVREASYPLYSTVLEVDRSFWQTEPGETFRFSWADDGIVEMPMRVMGIDYGRPQDRIIRLAMVEDIFGIEKTTYGDVPGSVYDPQRAVALPFDYELAMAAPITFLQKQGLTVEEIDADYPNVGVVLLGGHAAQDAIDFEAHTDVVIGTGSTVVKSVLTSTPLEVEALAGGLVAAVTSRIPVDVIDRLSLGLAVEGSIFVLGSTEAQHEFIMLETYHAGDEEWEVRRGLWDTIPNDWPVGTPIWAWSVDGSALDPNARSAGEVRTYRLLPRTSEGRLAYANADDITITVSERPHRPFRPANCQLEGAGFDTLLDPDQLLTDVTATWANRNRTTEDVIANRWDDPTVTGEPGQTTTLRVRDLADALIVEYAGETGTSKDIPVASMGPTGQGYVEFIAVNATGESLWNARRYFDLRAPTMSSTSILMSSTSDKWSKA